MRPCSFALALLAVALTSLALAAPAAAVVPTQWIAKMYTEALGRVPDQTGWQNSVDNFNTNGCSASTLQNHGAPFYKSSEFNGLGYDNPAKLLALYRGVLNREPDPGFTSNLNALNTGTLTWPQMVDQFFTSSVRHHFRISFDIGIVRSRNPRLRRRTGDPNAQMEDNPLPSEGWQLQGLGTASGPARRFRLLGPRRQRRERRADVDRPRNVAR
jgi:hypothetical protein